MGLFSGPELKSLRGLFIDQLQDIYDAEHRLTNALPKMAEKAHNPMLATAFRDHLKETERQIERLERVFEIIGESAKRKSCEAMKGLVAEGSEVLSATGEPDVIDAALICAAQRVEHYEMAGYGCLRSLASRLNLSEAVELLQTTLDEEGSADKKLTHIAETSVNAEAARA